MNIVGGGAEHVMINLEKEWDIMEKKQYLCGWVAGILLLLSLLLPDAAFASNAQTADNAKDVEVHLQNQDGTDPASFPEAIRNYTIPGKMVTRFDDMYEWSSFGNCTMADDAEFTQSDNGIRFTSTDDAGYMERAVKWSFAGTNLKFRIWFYLHSPLSEAGALKFVFSADETFGKCFEIGVWGFKEGWNLIDFEPNHLTAGYITSWGNPSWDDTFVRLRIYGHSNQGNDPFSVTLDSLTVDDETEPKVIFAFDDGYTSVYDEAFPEMEQYGLKGTSYVITNAVGGKKYMDIHQLQTLYDAGWDVANHSKDHMNYTGKTVAEIENSIQGGITWLNDNGFGKNALHLAMPNGVYNENVKAAIENCGLKTARSTMVDQFLPPEWEPRYLPGNTVRDTTPLDTVTGWINTAMEKGQTLILVFHGIAQSPSDEYEWSAESFAALCKYCNDRDVPVVTMSQWYGGLNDQ